MLTEAHQAWLHEQLLAARHRLKRYLVHANPDRLRHADDILRAYQLDGTGRAIAAAVAADLPLNDTGDGTRAVIVGERGPGVSILDATATGGASSSRAVTADYFPLSPPLPRGADGAVASPFGARRLGASGASPSSGGFQQFVPSSDDDGDEDTDDERETAPWRRRRTGAARSAAAEAGAAATRALAFRVGVFVDLQTARMMTDLVHHFHIAEPAPSDAPVVDSGAADVKSLAAIFTRAAPPSTTAAHHPAYAPPSPAGRRAAFASPRGAEAAHTAWAGDHTPYVRGATKPSGFDRREALCPVCGIEALNPAELQRHLQWRHGQFPAP